MLYSSDEKINLTTSVQKQILFFKFKFVTTSSSSTKKNQSNLVKKIYDVIQNQ
jgi:hypothetical protein